jgi:hypothetical protein
MKKIGAAVLLLGTAVLLLWGEWRTYERIADLYDRGQIGELSVLADRGITREGGKFASVVYHYDGILAGVPVRLRVFHRLKPGFRYPVFYFPGILQAYAAAGSRPFSAYVIGRKSDSKWDIFGREVGRPAFWLLAGFEVLWIAMGIRLLWRSRTPAP